MNTATSPSASPLERSLLIVDDEELNRDVLSRRLERAGYTVVSAANGPEALDKIREQEFELVLLDSMMPGMNGVDLLKLLRATYSANELPVIMVTAVAESDKVVEALSLGANDYITKPVDFAVALARIRSQLNRKWAEEKLRQSEERLSLVAQGTNDGLWDWDIRSGKTYFSPRWKEMIGYGPDEFGNSKEAWFAAVHEEDRSRLRQELAALQQPGGPSEFSSEHRILHKDGEWRWMLTRGMVLRDATGAAVRMAGSQTDVTRDRAFDVLTGLPNRVLFSEVLQRGIRQYQQDRANSFAVFFMDLDRFKIVNDSLGHLAGDKLLKEVSVRLMTALRSSGTATSAEPLAARLGGDEFAVFFPGIGSVDEANHVAAQIQRELYAPVDLDGKKAFTSASIGIAFPNAHTTSGADLLRDADTAMYRAKALGKGGSLVFDEEMRAQMVQRLELETDLRFALERDEFAVYYHPKVNLMTGTLVGFEALVRWNHPTQGLLMPGHFISLAEETGLIVQIGAWVLREACRKVHDWHRVHPSEPPIEVSVNLSVRQFRQPDVVEQIRQILEETQIDPSCLQLEVTESVFIGDTEDALQTLLALKQLGVGLKVDDFGTGYSSLNYLTKLPFDAIKIDRSFVTNMMEDDNSLEVIKAIIVLAKTLGKQVIAEGIETQDQLQRLLELGCGYGQGYLFSQPVNDQVAEQIITGDIPTVPAQK